MLGLGVMPVLRAGVTCHRLRQLTEKLLPMLSVMGASRPLPTYAQNVV